MTHRANVNLVVGLGASAVGLALLPFDGGHALLSGMKGSALQPARDRLR